MRVAADRAYEPDALVAPLPQPADDQLEIPDPVIVVEVLSPTPASIKRDLTTKVQGYTLVPSIVHYIVIDPADDVPAGEAIHVYDAARANGSVAVFLVAR